MALKVLIPLAVAIVASVFAIDHLRKKDKKKDPAAAVSEAAAGASAAAKKTGAAASKAAGDAVKAASDAVKKTT